MSTVVVENEVVHIPEGISDLDAFRSWADSEQFPESGRVCFLNGEVWADMTKEQLFTHILVKDEYTIGVGGLVRSVQSGYYFSDGLRLTSLQAGISVCPDGTFVSLRALRLGRAALVAGAEGGFVELEGTPDMVLEVVSDSSHFKDTVVLREAYWAAGIREYWLVDARQETLHFDVLRHTARGYVASRKEAGWIKSRVFGKSFKLIRRTDPIGHPAFQLKIR
jgi:hypothetical protein